MRGAHPLLSDMERKEALHATSALARSNWCFVEEMEREVERLRRLLEDADEKLEKLETFRENVEDIVDDKNYLSDDEILDAVDDAVLCRDDELERFSQAEEVKPLATAFAHLMAAGFDVNKLSDEGRTAFVQAVKLLSETT